MAFFKLRKSGDSSGDGGRDTGRDRPPKKARDKGRDSSRDTGRDGTAAPRQAESVEAMRRRARHRLIGAGVLVLIGVVGFPLLFDTQPRPIAVDIPIEIPDRNKVKPLPAQSAAAPAPSRAASPPAPHASAEPGASTAAAAPAAPTPAVKAEAAATPAPAPAPASHARAEPKADTRPSDGTRAQALLEGKPINTAQPAAEGRFIVQVGAFSDAAKSREARARLERAGIKTYTHVAETKEGKLIRVRVGPFSSKAEADQAAQKIKALDLSPHVLKL